ncbi:hypothetical protein GCM10009854_40830 [Saccharopolyspora halophila]|uniref:MacB-like periplasmic core domain-containing protein n=1 Tax=Saccharopolyspora halophila TaxID=405551 RepID=A0ABN3GQE2_9PSEU
MRHGASVTSEVPMSAATRDGYDVTRAQWVNAFAVFIGPRAVDQDKNLVGIVRMPYRPGISIERGGHDVEFARGVSLVRDSGPDGAVEHGLVAAVDLVYVALPIFPSRSAAASSLWWI